MPGFSPLLPLSFDNKDGFSLTQNYYDVARQNLKNLMLTNPGEKVMSPNFGIGIRTYIFEQNHETTYSRIKDRIKSQVKKYLPYLTIRDVEFAPDPGPDGGLLNIKVSYYINVLNFNDELQILVSI